MKIFLRIIWTVIVALLIAYFPSIQSKEYLILFIFLLVLVVIEEIITEFLPNKLSLISQYSHYLSSQPKLKSPLRGRKSQLEELEKLSSGSGQIIMVVGEPGIGKTALVSDFVTSHSKEFGFIAWQSLYFIQSVREIINGWLLNLNEPTPEMSIDSRIDFFLSKLKRFRPKRSLVVFDNTESIFKLDPQNNKTSPPDEFIWLLLHLINSQNPKFTVIITSSISLDPALFKGEVKNLEILKLRGIDLTYLRLIVEDRMGKNEVNDKLLATAAGNPSAAILLTDLLARKKISIGDHQATGRGLEKIVSKQLNLLDREQYAVISFLSTVRIPLTEEEIQNALLSIGYLRGTVRNSINELTSRHLIDEAQNGKKFAILIAAEVLVEIAVSELVTLFTSHDIKHIKLLRLTLLDHVRWADSMRNNSRQLVFSVAAFRIHQENGQEVSQMSSKDINYLFELIKSTMGSDDILGTNLLSFLISQDADLSDIALPNITLIGIDFSRSHLFNVDLRRSSLIDCAFADRIGSVYAVKITNQDQLLVGLASGSIELRRMANLSRITRCEAHSEPVRTVLYIPEIDKIVSGGEDGRLNIYDGSSLKILTSFHLHECWIWRLLTICEGKLLLSVASDGSIGFLDIQTLKVIGRATVPSRRLWDACTIDNKLFIASEDGVLWCGEINEIISSIENQKVPKWTIETKVADPIKTCCSIENYVVFGCRDGKLIRLDIKTGSSKLISIEDGCIRDVCVGSRQKVIISVGDNGIARTYDISSCELLSEYRVQSSRTWSIDVNQNGLAISGGDDRSLRLWDETTNTPIRSIHGHGQTLRSIDCYGDELMFACADDFLRIGNFSEKSVHLRPWLTPRPGRRILGAVSLLDERWACGFEDGVVVIGGKDGNIKTIKAHSSSIECIARNSTADRFATGSEDRQIKIFDPDGNIVVEPHQLHSSRIWALDFSPSGDKLVSAGGDFLVAVWDTHNGSVIWSGVGHNNLILAARWIDENRVVSAGTDGTLRLWVDGICSAVMPINCVVRYMTTDGKGIVYGVGRRSESLPGWMVIRWDINCGTLLQKEIGISGGSARAVILSNGVLFLGGDLPYLVEVDPGTLDVQNKTRIPGPYSGLKLRDDRISGTDLESVELLGAELLTRPGKDFKNDHCHSSTKLIPTS